MTKGQAALLSEEHGNLWTSEPGGRRKPKEETFGQP